MASSISRYCLFCIVLNDFSGVLKLKKKCVSIRGRLGCCIFFVKGKAGEQGGRLFCNAFDCIGVRADCQYTVANCRSVCGTRNLAGRL